MIFERFVGVDVHQRRFEVVDGADVVELGRRVLLAHRLGESRTTTNPISVSNKRS